MKLDLGSGYRHPEGFVTLDIREKCKPDVVCDLTNGLPFQDSSIEYIRAHDVLEHIPIGKTIFIMEEIYRVLKPMGTLDVAVPSTEGNGAFCDPYHVSFWNRVSFRYYMDDAHRNLYDIKAKFAGNVNNYLADVTNKIWYVVGKLKAVK